MRKRTIAKFSLNPDHPVDAELIKRLNAVGVRSKSSHLKLAACRYFGVLGHLVNINDPHTKAASAVSNHKTTTANAGINNNNTKDEDPLDNSSVFAGAFDNL
jgi:hypothetical protein